MRAAPDPRALTGWSGASPHVLRFSPAGFPPVSRLPAGFFPFVRRPLVSLRPAFSGSFPSAVARFRFPFGFPPGSLPLSNLHVSAAVRRFRRRWSRAAGTNVTSSAATTPLGSRDPAALQMGSGRARWDAATEPPVTSGRERRTSPRPDRPDTTAVTYAHVRAGLIRRSRVRPGCRRLRSASPEAGGDLAAEHSPAQLRHRSRPGRGRPAPSGR